MQGKEKHRNNNDGQMLKSSNTQSFESSVIEVRFQRHRYNNCIFLEWEQHFLQHCWFIKERMRFTKYNPCQSYKTHLHKILSWELLDQAYKYYQNLGATNSSDVWPYLNTSLWSVLLHAHCRRWHYCRDSSMCIAQGPGQTRGAAPFCPRC